MKVLKNFWLWFLALFPFGANAVVPLVIGGAAVGVGIMGVSIWRSVSPVDMASALEFFSSCWTCQIFSDVMISMSNLLPKVYSAIGKIVIPMAGVLLTLFTAWRLSSGFVNGKLEEGSKLMGNFTSYFVKFVFLITILLLPLPRIITSVLIEPALTIGTSLDYVVSDNNKFSECMIATAVADPVTVSASASAYGAFSPKLRHQLACEVANIHQVTGLGMMVGWTMMNMAFDYDYEHKIFWVMPIFPNVPIFFGGLLIFVLYFVALLPIPLYFLEVFVKLSMDLIMLPLMLMSWMFDDKNFDLFPKGGKTIRQMIDDVIKAIVGIALTVVFLTFSIMVLNAAFGSFYGSDNLMMAIEKNDSQFLIDGLMMANNSIVTLILLGIFMAMFMTMIPQLTNMLFKIQISQKYYETAKSDMKIMWENAKKWASAIKK